MAIQQTIKKAVECSGIGLHSGERVNLRLIPAPPDTGIIFVRKIDHEEVFVKVSGKKVVGTQLCTSIGENGTAIKTVEHLLSTLSGMEIDNLKVELDSAELPILDGSAEPFISMIRESGIEEQERSRKIIRILKPIEVRDGQKYIVIRPHEPNTPFPSEGLTIQCRIQYSQPVSIEQTRTFVASPENFVREIASARTFGFLNEVETLRAMGLAKGGSLKNAVVVSKDGVINEEGLRYRDEFVRHKILDLLGDLSLLGRPVVGYVDAFCPGHQLNASLVSKILESTRSWVLEDTFLPVVQPALS